MKTLNIAVAIVILGFLSASYSAPVYSATYFKCVNGYSFETNGNNAARCFKAAKKEYKSPSKCANVHIPVINKSIGHFLKKDYQGNKDKCVGKFKVGPVSNENAVDLMCPSGFRLEVRRGTDRCFKSIPAKAIAPSVSVNR